jgi:predicted TIM-barrel fold metal-dependent hydrolase
VGAIDYWCNAFTPDRRELWDAAIERQGLSLKMRRDGEDAFAAPAAMVARMDELGFETLLLPCAELPPLAGPFAYERYAARPEEVHSLAAAHPGRFAALWSFDPSDGMQAVHRAAEALALPGFVGLHLHTHSFDRPFDHRDLYPFYALAAEHRVPIVMQAGASGGLLASECGRPIGVDRPALYFSQLRFVLSHTGWPWVDEAIAMAGKHPNVYLGTAAFPPHHWSEGLVRFLAGAGRGKTLFGTGFPVAGHRQALARLGELELREPVRDALLEGAARAVFERLRATREEKP